MQDKVCIVTGATAGIGKGIAELFAQHGGRIVVSGRNAQRGKAVVQSITEAGGTALWISCDVGVDTQLRRLVEQTVKHLGGIDVLVNNAAAVEVGKGPDQAVAELEVESWDRQLGVNLRSAFLLSKLCIPHLKQTGGGTIVNISSVGSQVVWPNGAAYLASKGGLNQLTRSMALDYMADGIRVNALAPGWIKTAVEEERLRENPALLDEQLARQNIQRLGTPQEMAYAALFLACEESSYVTGTILTADGGWTLR